MAKKKKTSMMLDEATWRAFIMFSIQKTGSARNASNEAEQALKNYMTDPRVRGGGPEGESQMFAISLSNPDLFRDLRALKKEGFDFLMFRAWKK